MPNICQPLGNGVYAVDTLHLRPRLDASYLLRDEGRAAFVDTGTDHSVPNLLRALAEIGQHADQVDYILLTHVHLDHAGGAGRLASLLPNARVLLHPRGAAHMIDPAKLISATQAVYGASGFLEQYGAVLPIAPERVAAVEDGERIRLGRRTLEFLHTPGHALHHLSILERDTREIFTGDTFGVSYRELDTAAGEFIFPTTSPAQFDPAQLHASIDRIAGHKPACAYLTHFGRVGDIDRLAADLHGDLDAFVRIARAAAAAGDPAAAMRPGLFAHLSERLDAHGFAGDMPSRHAILDGDVRLNAAGLEAWLAREGA